MQNQINCKKKENYSKTNCILIGLLLYLDLQYLGRDWCSTVFSYTLYLCSVFSCHLCSSTETPSVLLWDTTSQVLVGSMHTHCHCFVCLRFLYYQSFTYYSITVIIVCKRWMHLSRKYECFLVITHSQILINWTTITNTVSQSMDSMTDWKYTRRCYSTTSCIL